MKRMLFVWILMICASLVFIGCKPIKIIPYVENKGDVYCVYNITDVQNNGTMHALKKGDIICLYCNDNTACQLYTEQWLHLYISNNENLPPNQINILTNTNISYRLELKDASTCVDCPNQNKFKVIPNP